MPMIANTMEEMVLVTSRTRGQHDVDARVVRAAARIRELIGGTSLQLALAVGSIVVEELYGGDLGRWRERGPKKLEVPRNFVVIRVACVTRDGECERQHGKHDGVLLG